jgi:holin-like protein
MEVFLGSPHMLESLTIIFLCQLAGEMLVTVLGLAVPGPVAGMLLLFAGLLMLGRVPPSLEAVSQGLLSHLSLLFIPAGVGVMLHAGLLGRDWVAIAVALVVSTLLAIAVAALVMVQLSGAEAEASDDGRATDA